MLTEVGKNAKAAARVLAAATTDEKNAALLKIADALEQNQEADRAWGLRQGAVAYLVKPIDETALLAAIRSME